MKHMLSVLAVAAAAVSGAGCGPEPLDVSGPWSGTYNLIVTAGETLAGSEGISVTQNGGDVHFLFAGCAVKARASGETTFEVDDFECQKQVNVKTWKLVGRSGSRITASPTQLNLSLTGDAQSGEERSTFSWTFTGTRAP
ncbi:MAG: hypothetical protein IRZ16_23175 [Myxococcaceae bacterium]|nr:hypothetical protein [Myxococcaceae bacterium]